VKSLQARLIGNEFVQKLSCLERLGDAQWPRQARVAGQRLHKKLASVMEKISDKARRAVDA